MSATDFICPDCGRLQGQVCKDFNGLSRWGRPHASRARLHTAAMRDRHESETLYVRVHQHGGGIEVDYSTDNPASDKGMLLYTHASPLRRSYTATPTQRRQWAQMDEQKVTVMSWEPNVEYRTYRIREMRAEQGYAIVYGAVQHNVMDFRVINLRDGSDSMLYSLDQCREIIQHAVADRLKGSFT